MNGSALKNDRRPETELGYWLLQNPALILPYDGKKTCGTGGVEEDFMTTAMSMDAAFAT
jgi:hypothetical protein